MDVVGTFAAAYSVAKESSDGFYTPIDSTTVKKPCNFSTSFKAEEGVDLKTSIMLLPQTADKEAEH